MVLRHPPVPVGLTQKVAAAADWPVTADTTAAITVIGNARIKFFVKAFIY
jgi:hypothetical protein